MKYAEMENVETGLQFKTPSGLDVETTGSTVLVQVHEIYVHEVTITDGTGKGETFLFNLDYGEAL